jgi:hypothetical protein
LVERLSKRLAVLRRDFSLIGKSPDGLDNRALIERAETRQLVGGTCRDFDAKAPPPNHPEYSSTSCSCCARETLAELSCIDSGPTRPLSRAFRAARRAA